MHVNHRRKNHPPCVSHVWPSAKEARKMLHRACRRTEKLRLRLGKPQAHLTSRKCPCCGFYQFLLS